MVALSYCKNWKDKAKKSWVAGRFLSSSGQRHTYKVFKRAYITVEAGCHQPKVVLFSSNWKNPGYDMLSRTCQILLSSRVSQPVQMCCTRSFIAVCAVLRAQNIPWCASRHSRTQCRSKTDLSSEGKEMKPVIFITRFSDLKFHGFSKTSDESIFVFTVH